MQCTPNRLHQAIFKNLYVSSLLAKKLPIHPLAYPTLHREVFNRRIFQLDQLFINLLLSVHPGQIEDEEEAHEDAETRIKQGPALLVEPGIITRLAGNLRECKLTISSLREGHALQSGQAEPGSALLKA